MPSSKHSSVIAIVGAGRVGRALGRLLSQRGWRIGAVVTRSTATARAAVRAIGGGTPHLFGAEQPRAKTVARVAAASFAAETRGFYSSRRADDDVIGAILSADVILIATPDAAIPGVARELAKIKVGMQRGKGRGSPSSRKSWRGKIILHTCGAFDRSVLRPLERRGGSIGSLHPLQTFGKEASPNLKGVACAVEGSPAALRAAQRICRDLGCLPIRVPTGAKPAYHAAAVFAAGHILGVIEAATRILMASGFSRRQAVQALLPLTRQTLANFERTGAGAAGSRALVEPAAIWTGPAARGDLATIRKNLAALRRFPREYGAAYAALTRLSIRLFARAGEAPTSQFGIKSV